MNTFSIATKTMLFFGLCLAALPVLAVWLQVQDMRLRRVAGVGVLLVAITSILEVLMVVWNLFGGTIWQWLWPYLLGSNQGQTVLVRLLLLVVMLLLIRRGSSVWLQMALLLGVVVSVSRLGHAGAGSNAWVLVTGDVVHLAAMVLWVAGLMVLAWFVPQALPVAAQRLSLLGTWAVALIVVTGSAVGVYRVFNFAVLTRTTYGQFLFAKLIVVALVLGVAWLNRVRFLPALLQNTSALAGFNFQKALRLEVIVLVGVMALAAALGQQPPPEPGAKLGETINFSEARGSGRVIGKLVPDALGGASLEFRFPIQAKPSVHLEMLDHPMVSVPVGVQPTGDGRYRGQLEFYMRGNWRLVLDAPNLEAVRVALRAQ